MAALPRLDSLIAPSGFDVIDGEVAGEAAHPMVSTCIRLQLRKSPMIGTMLELIEDLLING